MKKTNLKIKKRSPFDPHDAEDLRQMYISLKALPEDQMMYVAGYIRAVHDIDMLGMSGQATPVQR